ncbi:MAG: hypothetical protein KDI61_12495 [Alphaproteobacteria bacterium]|nr:hypothetical protein [Alphaproteobacteria bacterium]MCB1841062.1 hypothetical protein [Alphaproteobacteria bacterium]
MDIELRLSKEGRVVFLCQGRFSQRVEEIVMNPDSGVMSVVFEGYKESAELNSPVDMETVEKIKNEIFCALGYIEGGKVVAAEYVRFRAGVVY